MNEGSRKVVGWMGTLTAILLWFVAGVIGGATGSRRK